MSRPSVLIENWLPIEAIGAETRREHAFGTPFPAPNRLHVWWARRPLLTSRAAIIFGVLPEWSNNWPKELLSKFPSKKVYLSWVVNLIGIRGDPVLGQRLLNYARQQGQFIKSPFALIPRAFSINPSAEDLATFRSLLAFTWGTETLRVLDPFSGGGSIPFEALRYGFSVYANDLNPVAAVLLKATLEYPAKFGTSLTAEIHKWGKRWYELVKPRLTPFFSPLPVQAEGVAYLWSRTVKCPTTGKLVPLSPNWWLKNDGTPIAVKLIAEPYMEVPCFEVVTGAKAKASHPDEGTVSRGNARSPWTGETIDGEYIKAEAQSGKMGQILYAVVFKVKGGFEFRTPTDLDVEASQKAEVFLNSLRSEWETKNIIPSEQIPEGNKTAEPRRYGEFRWSESFSPRQLLSLGIFQDALSILFREIRENVPDDNRAKAIQTYLALALDKAVIYNNRHCRFDPGRGIRSVFDRHDFAFVWSHAEFDSSANLLPWALEQVEDAYSDLAHLVAPEQKSLIDYKVLKATQKVVVSQGSAMNLMNIPDGTITNITVDPPYYDNVQYAELADFFYVWLKRSVGHLYPELFQDELTNKDDEAVANPARFASMGSKKKVLAEQDYEYKMAAAFREMHRVLHPDGVLTVMFTHKRVEAWDTLASALIGAGFTIQASWPVHTESEHSLHQAKKNAAASTILLVCRKREQENSEPVWWDDIQEQVRRVAREKAEEFSRQGISGVDLYISTFGPTLSIISQHWPVLTSEVDAKTGQPKPLRPEIALDLAREEVVRLRKQGLLLGRDVQFDPVTDWYLMAWDAFKAEQFPYDEARKLAIALGIDLDTTLMKQKRIAAKKGQYIIIQTPKERRKKGMVDDEITAFPHLIDAVHTAMMVYEEDGPGACNVFLMKTGYKNDGTFKSVLQAMLNAIPRNRIKGIFVRPEAEVLENMRLAFFEDLIAPVEEEPELAAVQPGLFELEGEESTESDDE